MTLESLKTSLLIYISHFGIYDYVAFAWLILLFFAFIILAIFLARKSILGSILTLLLALFIFTAGPFILKHYLDLALRPTAIQTQFKRLHFSDTLIVTGTLKNISKQSFTLCYLDVKIVQDTHNQWKNYLTNLKPIAKKTILIQEKLETQEQTDFRVVFDRFAYNQDINTSSNATCY